MADYHPDHRFDGAFSLIKSEENLTNSAQNVDEDYRWRALTSGGVKRLQSSGNHADMVKVPHVKRLATLLSTIMSTSKQ